MKTIVFGDKKLKSLAAYMRMYFKLSDGEELGLDWYPKNYDTFEASTPIVIFVPGIFGHSIDKFSLEVVEMVYKRLGWRGAVFNRRLFGNESRGGKNMIGFVTFPKDMHEVLTGIHHKFPQADIFLIGCSMGAMNIQKYLIDFRDDNFVKAAA